jgi:hypothetical protein
MTPAMGTCWGKPVPAPSQMERWKERRRHGMRPDVTVSKRCAEAQSTWVECGVIRSGGWTKYLKVTDHKLKEWFQGERNINEANL